MADLNRKMAEGHTVSDLDTVIDEVYGAHGDYDTLGDRLDDIDTIIDTAKLGIHYKGEVNYYSNLPTTGVSIGDAYTVKYSGSSGTTPDGTEYVWGTVSGTNQWINFSKDSYTKAEVDALLALKVDTAGTGLSKSGTTLNHSNSTTAKTTQGFAQIAYDAQGHITGSTAATTAQANAINSGIDSTKVGQIETNKTNISLVADQSTKYNYINTTDVATLQSLNTGGTWNDNVYSIDTVTMTINSDGTITITASDETTVGVSLSFPTSVQLTNNNYYLFGCPAGGSAGATNGYFLLYEYKRGETTYYKTDTGNGVSFDYATGDIIHTIRITLRPRTSIATPIIFKPQLLLKTLYDAGFTDYQPYAMSNAELTAKEQANENNILNLQNMYATETIQVNLSDLTWTASSGGLGIYFSDVISLTTVSTVLSTTLIDFGSIKTTNNIFFMQTTSSGKGFRLLCDDTTFLTNASYVTYRIFGLTE